MPTPSDLLQFWAAALSNPLGVWIKTPDPSRLKSMLYGARAKEGGPEHAHLQIRTSVTDPRGEIWIIQGPREGEVEVFPPDGRGRRPNPRDPST